MKINYSNKLISRQIRQGFGIILLENEIPKLGDSKIAGNPTVPNNIELDQKIIEEYTLLFQLNLSEISFDKYTIFNNKMIYVFVDFENMEEGTFNDFKILCFDINDGFQTVELKNTAGVDRSLKLVEYYGLNEVYENGVLVDPLVENVEELNEYKNLKEILREEHFFGNYLLGVKDGGPGNPDITWTGFSDFPGILKGEQEINSEVLKVANQYEMLFCLSPYEEWGFFDDDIWPYSIRIGIKKGDLEQGNFDKIVVGY